MGVLLGPFDPIKLILNILNQMLQKGIVSVDEARKILYDSLDPKMSEDQKQQVLNDIIRRS